jgi:hypothetical protein
VVDLRPVSGAEARARPWLEQYAGRIAEAPVVAADFGEAVLGCRFGAGDPVERAERAEVDRVAKLRVHVLRLQIDSEGKTGDNLVCYHGIDID